MTEIIDELPGKKRLIPPVHKKEVERKYNIGVYEITKNETVADTDVGQICLYIKYNDGNYDEYILDEGPYEAAYNLILGLLKNDIPDVTADIINEYIEDICLEAAINYDKSLQEHLEACPGANPDMISESERRKGSDLWCRYLMEQGL